MNSNILGITQPRRVTTPDTVCARSALNWFAVSLGNLCPIGSPSQWRLSYITETKRTQETNQRNSFACMA